MGIQYFYRKEIFVIIKKSKYLCHHPKPPTIDYCPPPVDHQLPSATASIKSIFENIKNILENLIFTSNTPKILYLKKLFSKFPGMRIHSVYQTLPKDIRLDKIKTETNLTEILGIKTNIV